MNKSKYNLYNTRSLMFVFLFLIAFLERTIWDLGPNYELVTTAMILSSFYLGRKSSFWLTFAIVAASDRVIGNSRIFLFTWSGFLFPALISNNFIKYLTNKLTKIKVVKPMTLTVTGLSANLFFFIWTNFGVWLLDSWGMYSKDIAGLIKCYIYALPFLKNQLTSTIIFIPLGYFAIEGGLRLVKKYNLNGRFLQVNKSAE